MLGNLPYGSIKHTTTNLARKGGPESLEGIHHVFGTHAFNICFE